MAADEFEYTSMGGDIRIEGVDDKKDMEETRQTFSLLGKEKMPLCPSELNFPLVSRFRWLPLSSSPGLKEDFQSDVFKVLAAILHLGNVEIRNSGDAHSSVPVSLTSPSLNVFCFFCLRIALTPFNTPLGLHSPSSPVIHTWRPSVSC